MKTRVDASSDTNGRFQSAVQAVRTALDRPITAAETRDAQRAQSRDVQGYRVVASKRGVDQVTCGASRQWRRANYASTAGAPWSAALHRSAAVALGLPALATALPVGMYTSLAGTSTKERSRAYLLEHRLATDVAQLLSCLEPPAAASAANSPDELAALWNQNQQASDEIAALKRRCEGSDLPRMRCYSAPFAQAKPALQTHRRQLEEALHKIPPGKPEQVKGA